MHPVRTAIVGAGLSGLYGAWLLERMGLRDYLVLEARGTLGGRIASFDAGLGAPDGIDRFDLGPTWFWPAYQPRLDRLIEDLGLVRFEQHETGDTMIERSATAPPARVPGYVNVPASMRLLGGMEALIDALRRRLDPARVVTGETVRRLRRGAAHVELESEDDTGRRTTWLADHVLLALPPRLAEHAIAFSPPLPEPLAAQWRGTATWMAPHAKYVAVYERPFWRAQGLSGEARSLHGPLAEIHDASFPGGHAALFGFFGMPAQARAEVATDALRSHCRAQLARLFGPQAASPSADVIKDWAGDPFTATAADLDHGARHHDAPAAAADAGPWRGCLTGIASEWSPRFPGYVAGAIEAVELALDPAGRHGP